MQTPKRKAGKYAGLKPDPNITLKKYHELQEKLARLKSAHSPAVAEVKRLAEMGDFSDNAAYSIAKGRLRGLNQKILELEDHLKGAIIIGAKNDHATVALGSRVTVITAGREKTYEILGSAETDPQAGIISHHSVIGSALIGRRIGEKIRIETARGAVEYSIIRIE